MPLPSRDYFAELYVAGLMADAGWNVYFPHRDRGMDFIASKTGPNGLEIVRPIQVKGKYPEGGSRDRRLYGYIGRLNQRHPQMVLAIPYFESTVRGPAIFVAYMPFSKIRPNARGWRCQPAALRASTPCQRREYRNYFDVEGLALIELPTWG